MDPSGTIERFARHDQHTPQHPANLTGIDLSDGELAALLEIHQTTPVPPPRDLHRNGKTWERELRAALEQENP